MQVYLTGARRPYSGEGYIEHVKFRVIKLGSQATRLPILRPGGKHSTQLNVTFCRPRTVKLEMSRSS